MTDIFLYGSAANPNDIILRDPTIVAAIVARSTGTFGKKYPDRRHHDDEEWTPEEIRRYREQVRLSRERAEREKQNRLRAEEDRRAELLAIYGEITGESVPLVIPPKPARTKALKKQNDDTEKRILRALQRNLEQAELERRELDDLDDEEVFLMVNL